MGFTALTLPSANRIVKLFHLGGVLFAVCDTASDDVVYASSDGGATWVLCGDLGLFPSGYRVRRISEANGTFFICRDGLAAYSSNPTSAWALVGTSPASDDAYDFAYFNSFYWMGNSDGGTVYKSASPGSGYSAAYTSIGYGHEVLKVAGGRLFASSLDFGGASAGVVSTADGTTWAVETSDGINRFLISDGTDVFAVEDLGNGKARKFVTPGTWTAAVEAPDVTYPFWAFVQAGNLVSWAYPPGNRDVFDGSAWTSATETPPASYTSIDAATFDGTTEFVSFWDSVGSTSALYAFTGGGGGGGGAFVVSAALDITVESSAFQVSAGLDVTVATPFTVSAALDIHVVDGDVFGGLNGAGGWAAAPDGRWQATVMVGGVDRSAELLGTISVRREHTTAALAELDLRPSVPMAPLDLIGKPVRIAFAQRGPSGEVLNAQLMFLGVVEQPEYNPAQRTLHLLCTDQYPEVMRNTGRGWIDANIGGRFSAEVSGEPADNLAYAQERLASVPKSLALDVMGTPRVIPWRNAAMAVRVTEADGVDGTPTVRLPSRAELISRVVVNAEYRYQVARNRGILSQWSRPARWFINGPDNSGFPIVWLTTDMVEGALGGLSGWTLEALSVFHPIPGDYAAGIGVDSGVYTIKAEKAPDLAIGWRAWLSTRWQQTRTEQYTLTVVASNVEAMLERPAQEEVGVSVSAPDLPDAWAADESVTPRFAAALGTIDPDTISAALMGDTNHVHEPDLEGETAWDTFTAAALTLIDRARIRLWESSRSGRVSFQLPCRPDLWLDRRVEVEVPGLHCDGDLIGVTHTLDTAAGTAITELTLAVGLPGDSDSAAPTWALPDRPDPDAVLTPGGGAGLGGVAARHTYYVGGLGSSPDFNEATMIGFATNSTRNNLAPDIEKNALNWYPLQLTIEAPEIPDSDRDPLDIPVAQSYAWAVPTDLLEII